MCSSYLSSVWVADWPPFVKELLTRLTICSFCILTICNLSYFPFCFRVSDLIVSVPGLCMLFSFKKLFASKSNLFVKKDKTSD